MAVAPILLNPAVAATPIPPFSPIGRPTGGSGPTANAEESANTTFAPLVEVEETRRSGELSARDRDARRGQRPEPGSPSATQEAAEERREQQEIRKLAARDREVRAHEQAHAAVGGQYAGAPSFSFTRGPDGVRYATGGEVPIDVSRVSGDPEATIRKMQVVRRAALAPADPSAADRSIAARATRAETDARIELAQERAEESAQRREEQRGGADSEPVLRAGQRFSDRVAGTGALDLDRPPRAGAFIDTAA